MNPLIRIIVVLLGLLSCLSLSACRSGDSAQSEQSHEHGAAEAPAAADFERGPHRGRLLRDGPFALELQIFEEGVPPEFHAYLYRNGKPLTPNAAQVSVNITRLDGEVNHFTFTPQADFLRGNGTVHEPHSFNVEVTAEEPTQSHHWTFESFEGRTTIPAATAEAAGVRTETAGPTTIKDTLLLTGRLVPNAERMRAVSARFPGAIREVLRSVGDTVRQGDRLALIESNESLETYAMTAPIAGVITERHANPGENTNTDPMFVIVDYSALWAELALFPRDLARVKTGQKVTLRSIDGDISGNGTVVRIAPTEGTQHGAISGIYTVRVALDNTQRHWTPGLFVEGNIHIGESPVPLAVKRSGLQIFRDFTVVFTQVGETYEVRMLDLGKQDDTWVEVLGGLKAGARYVAQNSYLIKADIEKSGASHDH
jgi:cobalt-zinc-cadmium efflux system membrane fusion protein